MESKDPCRDLSSWQNNVIKVLCVLDTKMTTYWNWLLNFVIHKQINIVCNLVVQVNLLQLYYLFQMNPIDQYTASFRDIV